ncbi:MAG: DUF420 domain-containing protein [Rhodospirillales bacterium]
MLSVNDLPHVNAALNGITVILLGLGYWFIRRREMVKHRACMLTAVGASAAFLVTYLIYHFNAGLAKFGGEGIVRPVYFTILLAHVVIAVLITPLVPMTLSRALTSRFDQHRRLARWTWPLWMYVALSGVVVYVMAIHLYPFVADVPGAGTSSHG